MIEVSNGEHDDIDDGDVVLVDSEGEDEGDGKECGFAAAGEAANPEEAPGEEGEAASSLEESPGEAANLEEASGKAEVSENPEEAGEGANPEQAGEAANPEEAPAGALDPNAAEGDDELSDLDDDRTQAQADRRPLLEVVPQPPECLKHLEQTLAALVPPPLSQFKLQSGDGKRKADGGADDAPRRSLNAAM